MIPSVRTAVGSCSLARKVGQDGPRQAVFSSEVSLRILLALPFASFVTQAILVCSPVILLVALVQQPQRHKLLVMASCLFPQSTSPFSMDFLNFRFLCVCVCGGGLGHATQMLNHYPTPSPFKTALVFLESVFSQIIYTPPPISVHG